MAKSPAEGKNAAVISLGCDKNLTDSEVMLGLMKREGYTITSDLTAADVLILNTCGFISDAVDESYQTAREMARHKKNGRCKALIITGCMAQRYKDQIFEKIPEADAVLGTGSYEQIVEVANKALQGEKTIGMSDINQPMGRQSKMSRILSTPSHYAYLKIAEGCDNKCTYCTIPALRGCYRSRSMEDILEEAEQLAAQGVKELVLVAQDTSLYGRDLYGQAYIDRLLKKLSEIDGIKWIRLLYCYPEHITEGLIREIAENSKVVPYIDMPIQHASDKILKKMGRKSSKQQLERVIIQLRDSIPEITIRTTLITGFPGETKEDFDELLDFVKRMQFDRLGVFAYSREEGTPAYHLPDQVERIEKIKRQDTLMRAQQRISAQLNTKKIGKRYQVLIEGRNSDGVFYGRTCMDCPEVDGLVFFKGDDRLTVGSFAVVEITDAAEYDLIGITI